MQYGFSDIPPKDNFIEINYCKEGRIECEFYNGSYKYLAKGDISIKHIFSKLYTVPKEIKSAYFKIKTLELLLF